jgi:citrate synthase
VTPTFEETWGLVVDGDPLPGLEPADPFPAPARTGDLLADLHAGLAQLGPRLGFRPLRGADDARVREELGRCAAHALSFTAQGARGTRGPLVPAHVVDEGKTLAERFLIEWRGEPDARRAAALDALWAAVAAGPGPGARGGPADAAARVAAAVARSGASAPASLAAPCAALDPGTADRARAVLAPLRAARRASPAGLASLARELTAGRGAGPAGFTCRAREDRRAGALRDACVRLGAPLHEGAARLADAFAAHGGPRPGWFLWAVVLADAARVRPPMLAAVLACARTADWSARVRRAHRTAGCQARVKGQPGAGLVFSTVS